MTSASLLAANATEPAPDHAAKTIVRADQRTGRLVRSVVVNPKVVPPKAVDSDTATATPVSDIVESAARSYGLDPLLVDSVIRVESNYNPFAISNKGAEGLMQLIPSTARRFGVNNSFSPRENIDAGARYLRYLKNIFGEDRLALAAYNAGEAAVAKFGSIPPYRETQDYVDRVGKKYGEAKRAAAQKPAATAEAQPAGDEHPKLEQYHDEQGRICLRTR